MYSKGLKIGLGLALGLEQVFTVRVRVRVRASLICFESFEDSSMTSPPPPNIPPNQPPELIVVMLIAGTTDPTELPDAAVFAVWPEIGDDASDPGGASGAGCDWDWVFVCCEGSMPLVNSSDRAEHTVVKSSKRRV